VVSVLKVSGSGGFIVVSAEGGGVPALLHATIIKMPAANNTNSFFIDKV